METQAAETQDFYGTSGAWIFSPLDTWNLDLLLNILPSLEISLPHTYHWGQNSLWYRNSQGQMVTVPTVTPLEDKYSFSTWPLDPLARYYESWARRQDSEAPAVAAVVFLQESFESCIQWGTEGGILPSAALSLPKLFYDLIWAVVFLAHTEYPTSFQQICYDLNKSASIFDA